MQKLSKTQETVIQRLKHGDILYYFGYVPMLEIHPYCQWKGDDLISRGIRENPIRSVKALIKKKIVRLEKTDIRRKFSVNLCEEV